MDFTPSTIALLEILKTGDFTPVISLPEGAELEAKLSPYTFSSGDWHKQELAKDVSALANAGGGTILIGFRTAKADLNAVEQIDDCNPFDLSLVSPEQYRKILEDWVYPPLHSIKIECYALNSHKTRGVAAIHVPMYAANEKPFVVTRTTHQDGNTRGTLVGYYERVQDRIPATSPEMIRTHLRDGMRFNELALRLTSIESIIGALSSTATPPSSRLSDDEIAKRITEAQTAVERISTPCIVLTAVSSNATVFSGIFNSHSEVVRLLNAPPKLREQGFGIHMKNESEIIRGEFRRSLLRTQKIIDLWRDGFLVAIGQGDDDLLCWATGRQRKPGLPIRNFVLAEVTLNFLNFAIGLFRYAEPPPKELKIKLVLTNMTEEGVPCILSSIRDNTQFPFGRGNRMNAPGAEISSEWSTPFKDLDVGIVAYELLGGLYAKFGFNYDDMPYLERDKEGQERITLQGLLENIGR